MMNLHHSPPPLVWMDLLGPIPAAFLLVTVLSRLPRNVSLKLNALGVVGAGAAYIGHGLGVVELLYTAVASMVLGWWALHSFRVIGLGWLMHVAWDVVHHAVATPIWPFLPSSSASCAVFDTVLAVWLLADAPVIGPKRLPTLSSTTKAALLLVEGGTLLSGCQFFSTYNRIYGDCEPPQDTAWSTTLPPISDDAVAYTPRFALWTDGAAKERFISLPPGQSIDTANPNAWRFPMGTRLWKTFSLDDKRLETRLLEKTGPDANDWRAVSYAWNEAQTTATVVVDGAENVLGTEHDIPSAATCLACHGGGPTRVLGFSAVQLTSNDIDAVVETFPAAFATRPSQVHIPGRDVDVRARGALHANCAHCHSAWPSPEAQDCFNPHLRPQNTFDFSIRADAPDVLNAQHVLVPGDGKRSKLVRRFGKATPYRPAMPPLGTEVVDDVTKALLVEWIDHLTAETTPPSPN